MRQLKIQKSITNRSSEALDKYLVEIGRAPLISIEEEIDLAQKIKKEAPKHNELRRNSSQPICALLFPWPSNTNIRDFH